MVAVLNEWAKTGTELALPSMEISHGTPLRNFFIESAQTALPSASARQWYTGYADPPYQFRHSCLSVKERETQVMRPKTSADDTVKRQSGHLSGTPTTAQTAPNRQPPARGTTTERRLAWLLDESIRLPGGFRIGLDGLIGLVPGIGDGIGAASSSYILYQAYRSQVSKPVFLRMLANILIESIVGVVPVLGDLFDMVWKSNSRNVRLLERHGQQPEQVSRVSFIWLAVAVAVIGVLTVGTLWLAVKLIAALFGAVF